jgi:putative DNA methylase
MTDQPTPRKPVFIEKIFPVKLLNQQVYYEHGGNPFKGLHRWYSRKPLSFSRASVLGSILPEGVTIEEFEYLLGLNRRVGGLQDTKTKLYKTPPSADRIAKVHDLCEGLWGTRTPTVLDAFAGGGSIPFEAARYGLNVLASDLNPVAVVTMKAAIEYPLKFGPDLQVDIDKWVKWVGDEAKVRLAEFFPSQAGETVVNYLWAHTVVCPSCESVVPLSPNWWLYKRPEKQNLSKWCAVRPVPNLKEKRVDFELVRGKKGKGDTIVCENGEEYDPSTTTTLSRAVGKCLNCNDIIEDNVIRSQGGSPGLGHQLYAIAHRKGQNSLEFRVSGEEDLLAITRTQKHIQHETQRWKSLDLIPDIEIPHSHMVHERNTTAGYGLTHWHKFFNSRQLLTSIVYVEIINEVKLKLQQECDLEKSAAILTYLALVLDRCVDVNCRLSGWDATRIGAKRASAQHSLNLMWNYPETSGGERLWQSCADVFASDYQNLCELFGDNFSSLFGVKNETAFSTTINLASADNLLHIPDKSLNAVVTDPPYYGTIQYAEMSDFFYVWQKRTLGDIFPELYWSDFTDKDREAVANPSRFRNMGISPEELANQDYEAKMALAFAEYHRVLRDDGVMTVQFNHKDSGAWDTLAKSLIDSGFEITASWAVSTENPQNLHQAQKNSVSSTVLLVCRKRDPNAGQAWWDDLRPQVTHLVETRAPEFEANDIDGIDLYLSAFGPALNIFSRNYPILDTSGHEVRPEQAFAEARKAIANYRFHKLAQTDTAGFDPITTWYILAWDAFRAREFPFDEARQLALAVGGFNLMDLHKIHKLAEIKGGNCKLLTPDQRLKKRAFSTNPDDFTLTTLIDALHATIAIYLEEGSIDPVRRFLKGTDLLSNDRFMRAWEITLRAIPHTRDTKKRIPEEQALADLWLAMDEIKAKVRYVQPELELVEGQCSLF